MKVFFRFLKEYPKESVLAPLFKLLEACFDLLVPLVVASIIDNGIGGGDRVLIIKLTLLLCARALVGLTCALCAQYFAARAARSVKFWKPFQLSLTPRIQSISAENP